AVAELIDRDLGASDLGHGVDTETAENIADAPDSEADDQKPDHRRHDDLAEPIGRGFSQTSKHERYIDLSEWERPRGLPQSGFTKGRRFRASIIRRSEGHRNHAVRDKKRREQSACSRPPRVDVTAGGRGRQRAIIRS